MSWIEVLVLDKNNLNRNIDICLLVAAIIPFSCIFYIDWLLEMRQTDETNIGLFTDMQQMESQMQQMQRRKDEARDPVLNQLKAVTETMQRREQSQEPVHERLNGAVEALRVTNAQMVTSTGELESKLLKKINGLVCWPLLRETDFERKRSQKEQSIHARIPN